jgi:Uma2 family endonuclease
MVIKKNLYEKAGVKEYFIVNPSNRNTCCFVLQNGKYALAYEAKGKFASALLSLAFDF